MHPKVVMRKNRRLSRISEARLEEMTEQAVDAFSESERITGWFTMIKENLGVPFETTVLEVLVAVCNSRAHSPARPTCAGGSNRLISARAAAQSDGRQAEALGLRFSLRTGVDPRRELITVSFVPHNWPRRRSEVQESWSEWQDLNLRPPRPERGALPDGGSNVVRSPQKRQAAATARKALIDMAAEKLNVPAADLTTADGMVRRKAGGTGIKFADLLVGKPRRRITPSSAAAAAVLPGAVR
jgi:hypothetical protein